MIGAADIGQQPSGCRNLNSTGLAAERARDIPRIEEA
jgi:hypothetical protein